LLALIAENSFAMNTDPLRTRVNSIGPLDVAFERTRVFLSQVSEPNARRVASEAPSSGLSPEAAAIVLRKSQSRLRRAWRELQ
jgi:hypothetical protein